MKYLILDYLEATAARLPEKVAFTDETSAVSFSELVRLSRAVGSALTKHVAPRTTVGFYMDKSVQTVAGFFGAVYAGCSYSLLNLRHPAVRIRAILDTLASPVIITDRACPVLSNCCSRWAEFIMKAVRTCSAPMLRSTVPLRCWKCWERAIPPFLWQWKENRCWATVSA